MWITLAAASFLAAASAADDARAAVEAKMPVTRWEETIQKIEQRQAVERVPKGAMLFAGSSTIVGWDLGRFFPDMPTVNRGFGGSHIRDSVYYADRIIIPVAPETIVLYAGDNDIEHGLTPEDVAEDFQQFAKKIHGALPDTRILYLSIKPSLARWDKWPAMKRANELIEVYTRTDKRLEFVDTTGVSLGPDGKPDKELLQKDGLHLNKAGYKAWTAILAPRLKKLRGK